MGPKGRNTEVVRRSPRLSSLPPGAAVLTSESFADGMRPKRSRRNIEVVHRSPRLSSNLESGKSAKTSPSESPSEDRGMTSHSSHNDIEKIMRADREHEAIHFKKIFKLNDDCPEERKTCIHPRGEFDWSERSFGITWVAFRGTDSTYVAFRRTNVKDGQTSYLAYNPAAITFDLLGTSIVSKIEVLASSQKFPKTCKVQNVQEPFAIVSVVPGTVNDDHEEAALNYLYDTIVKGKMKDCNPVKAKVAAVRALQKLYGQTFKPEDIWVLKMLLVHESCDDGDMGLPDHSLEHLLDVVNWAEGDESMLEEEMRDAYKHMLE